MTREQLLRQLVGVYWNSTSDDLPGKLEEVLDVILAEVLSPVEVLEVILAEVTTPVVAVGRRATEFKLNSLLANRRKWYSRPVDPRVAIVNQVVESAGLLPSEQVATAVLKALDEVKS